MKTKGAAVSRSCGRQPPKAGGYGNELVGMQMRLVGDLHGAGLGGAKVEQVGEATGNSLSAPGALALLGKLPTGKAFLNAPALQQEIPGQLLRFNHSCLCK